MLLLLVNFRGFETREYNWRMVIDIGLEISLEMYLKLVH